jgi:hypothetical protein
MNVPTMHELTIHKLRMHADFTVSVISFALLVVCLPE